METFNKCIQTLRQAKSDNERLAALMIISKITHTLNVDKTLTEQLHNALSSTFLLRLLKSSTHDDENSVMFQQLALTILTVILKGNPGALNKEPEILKQLLCVLKDSKEGDGLRDDLLGLLIIISEDAEGSQVLLENNILDTIINKHESESKVFDFLKTILKHESSNETWSLFLLRHSEVLVNNQDLEKFHELELLCKLVNLMCIEEFNLNKKLENKERFIQNIYQATQDLFKSRIKPAFKQTAVCLLSDIIKLFGLDAIFTETKDKAGFLILNLTVISVELSCLFSLETPMDSLLKHVRFINKSFYIVKAVLIYICSESFEDDELAGDSKFIVHLFETFKNIMSSVYCFLQSNPHKDLDNPVLLEALIMICVWATEETETLQEELKTTIPLMVRVAEFYVQTEQTEGSNDFFASFIPCCAQNIPDEKIKKVLKTTKYLAIIQQYTVKKLTDKTPDRSPQLECLIHFFHELIIVAPACCRSATWPTELTSGLVNLYRRPIEYLKKISMYSQNELLIILLRLPLAEKPLDVLLPLFLKDLTSFGNEIEEFKDCYEEIWFIAVQAFLETVTVDRLEREKLRGNREISELLEDSDNVSSYGKEFIEKCRKVLCG